MFLSIDITESFGAIYFDNAGGVKTYINNPLRESLNNTLILEISNFVLNLIDVSVACSINKLFDVAFSNEHTTSNFNSGYRTYKNND